MRNTSLFIYILLNRTEIVVSKKRRTSITLDLMFWYSFDDIYRFREMILVRIKTLYDVTWGRILIDISDLIIRDKKKNMITWQKNRYRFIYQMSTTLLDSTSILAILLMINKNIFLSLSSCPSMVKIKQINREINICREVQVSSFLITQLFLYISFDMLLAVWWTCFFIDKKLL